LYQEPSTQRQADEFTPLPESAFIQDNVLTQNPVQPSTATSDGNVLRKRQVLAAAKLKAAAARRDIADQAKFDAAMAKLQQEEEKRAEAAEQKKAQALAKKIANEEKKRADREAKQRAAEEKKIALAEKKKKAQEEKLAIADKKKLAQEARKKEAEETKERKRLAMEAMKKEAEEAKRKQEEDARTLLNNAITHNLEREEEARQREWEDHLKKLDMIRDQTARHAHDNAELERILAWKEKRRLAEEANKVQAAQFRATQQAGMLESQNNKRKCGDGRKFTHRTAYKQPKKTGSMFDYLRGPPPGLDSTPPGHDGTPPGTGTATDV
jgi:hypothetical protein